MTVIPTVILPPGDPRLPGDPETCPVSPCPGDCPGMAACRVAKGLPATPSTKPSPVITKIQVEIAERDKLHTQLTGDNNNSD